MNGMTSKPAHEVKVGAVRAIVWINPQQASDGKKFNNHKIVVERTYKDTQGNFKNTNLLDTNDVPKAILALKKCYEWITIRKPNSRKQEQITANPSSTFKPASRYP